ncbi:hypothetical protein BH11CYA1_BH11CYA1_06190 [soil metagenome]
MTDRSDVALDAPISKFNAADNRSKDGGGEDGLHRELHGMSSLGANPGDNLVRTQAQGSLESSTLPPLTIDGLAPKKTPDALTDGSTGSKPEGKAEGKLDGKLDDKTDGKPEAKEQTDQEKDAARLAESEMLGQYSINGQNRYLDTAGTRLTTVKMDGAASDGKPETAETDELPAPGVPPPGPVPYDLKEIVGEEREAEFSKAFELMDSFDKSVNDNVLKPGVNKLSDMLDQAERDMPKAKLDALEADRKKYGEQLKDFQESIKPQPDGSGPVMTNLLYREPPERGPAMKEFDRTVQGITTEVGKEMAANMQAVGNKFNESGDLSAADEKVQEYYQLKEDLALHPEPEPQITDV